MSKVIFIADFFDDQVTGGAEINDATLIKFLEGKQLLFEKINSHNVTKEYLFKNKDKYFIVSNFVRLSNTCKDFLYHHLTYSIYEHDYKFLINRNPIDFPNFIAPKFFLTNVNFYKRAHCVICLSKMHKEIYENNLNLENLHNIGTSLFSEELIEFLLSLSKKKKKKKYAVIKSTNPIKKTTEAIAFCHQNGYAYDLISHENNSKFLEILSGYENLVFMTGHPEPTPRLAIECKLLGVNMIAPRKLIGIASEEWYNTSGEDFVTGLRRIRGDAENFFIKLVSEGVSRIQDAGGRKVFLDGGGHRGESIDKFRKYFKGSSEFEIHSFEPNPLWKDIISEKGHNVLAYPCALWIEDGKILFYGTDVPQRSDGCSVVYEKNNISRQKPIEVPSIDFGKWIIDNFSKEDYIILKLDIEGAEYKVLEKMMDDGSLSYVDMLYIEFHAQKMDNYMDIHNRIVKRLKDMGKEPLFWDALDRNFTPDTQAYRKV